MSRQHYRMMMMILISVRSYMELILPGPACLPPGIKKSPIQNRMRRGEEKKLNIRMIIEGRIRRTTKTCSKRFLKDLTPTESKRGKR